MNKVELTLLIICNLIVGCIIGWLTIYTGGVQAIILAIAYLITILVMIVREQI